MLVGTYVGIATVGVFVTWYTCHSFLGIDLSADGHTTVSLWQLRHWQVCRCTANLFSRSIHPAPSCKHLSGGSLDKGACQDIGQVLGKCAVI